MTPIRSTLSALCASLFVLSAMAGAPAAHAASDGPYRMDVLVDGSPTAEYRTSGATYVEARKSREYAVRLSNNTGSRVAVALAVDGMNSIDAKHTSAAAARKWILMPYESIVVTGWQTSSDTARQFFFTSESGSYGAWTGKTRNLGNISAAFFREQAPEPQPYYRYYPEDDAAENEGAPRESRDSMARADKSAAKRAYPSAPASAAPSASGAVAQRESSLRSEQTRPMPSDEPAATGIGRERSNQVYTVDFKQQSSPAAVLTVRYEFREKLIEMGVLPRPYRPDAGYRRETSSGFSDYGYAPDPNRGR